MSFCSSRILLGLTLISVLFPLSARLCAQANDQSSAAAAVLPEAPLPQIVVSQAPAQPPAQQQQPTPPQQPVQSQQSAQTQPGSSSSSATEQQPPEKSEHDKAEEQLKKQEKQRVMGVMATFNTTRDPNAVPLSPAQKFKLYFKSATDPWPFLLAGSVAGIGQANNSHPEWGQGARGYAKRFGGAYTDAFIGNFFGNAVLTSILREDPRYFQKGTGSPVSRILWAASSSVWCKRDNGKWGPNYANVVGNLIGSSIANLYYPDANPSASDTIQDGLTVTAEGIIGAEVIEFWPDLVRRHNRKKAEKLARKNGAADQQPQDGQKPTENQK
jgi:hypothetical protein